MKKAFAYIAITCALAVSGAMFGPAFYAWAAAKADKITTVGGLRTYYSIYDEDDMATDSATGVATQQATKAYIDSGTKTMTNVTLTSPTITGGTGFVGSALTTNSSTAANSVWGASNGLSFECATADARELIIQPLDDATVADATVKIPSLNDGTVVISTLITNDVDVANSVWMTSNDITFECTTADAQELILTPLDDATVADATVKIPSLNDGILVISTLATNDVDVANSVWMTSNDITFEGATGDSVELSITVADPVGTSDPVVTIGSLTGSVVVMIADTGTASGHTLVDGSTLTNCTTTIPAGALSAGGSLRVHAMGTFAGGNAAGKVHLSIDGTDICSVTQATAGADDWVMDCTMYQVTAASQEVDCVLNADTDAAIVATRAVDTTNFAAGAIVVAVGIESQNGSDTTTLESCQIFAAP